MLLVHEVPGLCVKTYTHSQSVCSSLGLCAMCVCSCAPDRVLHVLDVDTLLASPTTHAVQPCCAVCCCPTMDTRALFPPFCWSPIRCWPHIMCYFVSTVDGGAVAMGGMQMRLRCCAVVVRSKVRIYRKYFEGIHEPILACSRRGKKVHKIQLSFFTFSLIR